MSNTQIWHGEEQYQVKITNRFAVSENLDDDVYINQLSGYDILRHHAVLCIVVGMASLYIMHVSNYSVGHNESVMQIRTSCLLDLLVTSECDRKMLIDWLIDICRGFELLRVNFMVGPSKKMGVSDEVLYELLQENEYSYISESEFSSDSKINVKMLSCDK
jgi:hypothetical protein